MMRDKETELTLRELLDRAFRGERGAENALAHLLIGLIDAAVSRDMLIWAAQRTMDKGDLVQTVLEHLCEDNWKRMRKYDPGRPLPRWVSEVTHNRLSDLLRRKHRTVAVPGEDIEEALLSEATPEDSVQMRKELARVAGGLSDEQLMLIQMRYFDGAPDEDVAAHLGISVEAARRRVQRAAANMRAIISTTAAVPAGFGGYGGLGDNPMLCVAAATAILHVVSSR